MSDVKTKVFEETLLSITLCSCYSDCTIVTRCHMFLTVCFWGLLFLSFFLFLIQICHQNIVDIISTVGVLTVPFLFDIANTELKWESAVLCSIDIDQSITVCIINYQ